MISFFSKEEVHSTVIMKNRRSCFSCGLLKESSPLEPYGNFKKRILIIGEFPSGRDVNRKKPWQGKDGLFLQRTLQTLGIDLFEDCLNIYSVFCTPIKKPTSNQMDCCRDIKVLKVLEKYEPKVVILLGSIPLMSIIGSRWNKSLGGLPKWRGFTVPDIENNTWICPTFAPDYVTYMDSPEVEKIWKDDLERAINVGKLPKFNEPNIHYIEDLSILDTITGGMAAFDYETTGIKPYFKGHRIICASVAYDSDNVYTFIMPKKKSERAPFLRFLSNGNIKKIASNMKYEDQWSAIRLKTEVQGWFHDTMLTAHLLDNRRGVTGLKFQSFVEMGIVGYSDDVDDYITKSHSKENRSNAINKISELMEQPGGPKKLLKYCALDSIYEYRLAEIQMKQMKRLL